MRHVNWVQQNEDYATRYHVLQWKTSHFHEPFSIHASGGAKLKQGAAGPSPQAGEIQAETEGMGFGQSERGSGRLGLGLGLEDALANTVAGNERGRDGVNISTHGAKVQEAGVEAARTVVQSAALAQVHAAENTVTPTSVRETLSETEQREEADRENTTVAESGRGNIRNRLRESAARLREAYQRQKEKAAKGMPLRQTRPEKQDTIRKGTRMADREAMLAMQAENHYLLDSYDQNGNYSVLGKK